MVATLLIAITPLNGLSSPLMLTIRKKLRTEFPKLTMIKQSVAYLQIFKCGGCFNDFHESKETEDNSKKTKFLDLVAKVQKRQNLAPKKFPIQVVFFSLSIKFFSSLGNERFGSFFGTELKSPPMFG